jgi:hypothetical protein
MRLFSTYNNSSTLFCPYVWNFLSLFIIIDIVIIAVIIVIIIIFFFIEEVFRSFCISKRTKLLIAKQAIQYLSAF